MSLNREGINKLSYQEYSDIRDTSVDLKAIGTQTDDWTDRREINGNPFVLSYELEKSKKEFPELVDFWRVINFFKGLLQIFGFGMAAYKAYSAWYNLPAENNRELQVVPPREMNFRCFSDIYGLSGRNGIVVAIENTAQTALELDAHWDWYGIPEACLMPNKIESFATGFYELVNAPAGATAARGIRYKINSANTFWYAYIAAYTYAFGGNYVYVELLSSSAKQMTGDELYYKLTTQTSFSKPEGCPFMMQGAIDAKAYRAKVVVQITEQTEVGVWKSISDWLSTNWKTPKDYQKDEL